MGLGTIVDFILETPVLGSASVHFTPTVKGEGKGLEEVEEGDRQRSMGERT